MFFSRRKVKVGIAFGGGGARGFAHLGAIKAFEQFGIKFDFIAGTSAGSLVGAFYANGYNFKQLYQVAKSVRMKDIRKSVLPFTASKLDGLAEVIKSNLGEKNIEDCQTPFAAVAVDLKSAKEVCFVKGELASAVCGSCAVPGVFQPVEYNDMILADGGLQNTIPADIPKYFGCDYVVAVDVNKSRLYGTNSTKLFDVLSCSIRILMKSNAIRGYVNGDVVIGPETKRFKSTSTDGLDDMIDEGYKATIDAMPKILELFRRKPCKKKKVLPDDIVFVK